MPDRLIVEGQDIYILEKKIFFKRKIFYNITLRGWTHKIRSEHLYFRKGKYFTISHHMVDGFIE